MTTESMPREVGSNAGLGPVPRWWTCATHGDAMPANAWGCPECVREMRVEIGQLRHALAQSGKLAEDRLEQMKTDRAEFLAQRRKLDRALTVCRCAARVVDSSAYQGVSDEDCDLENAVRNWRQLGA
jgi:hypothetical protein